MTWPKKDKYKYKDKDKDNGKDKYIQRALSKSYLRELKPLRHLIRMMKKYDLTKKNTMTKTITKTTTINKTNTCREHLKEQSQRLATFETFDQSDEEA